MVHVQVDRAGRRDLCKGGGAGQFDGGNMGVGGAAGNMIDPAAAKGRIEKDALETMIRPDRPAASGGQSGQDRSRQIEPARLKRGAAGPFVV